jgi:Reverse transcriptase (RNA-dependent DNA polymerase)
MALVKVNIHKAFDSIRWHFLVKCLQALGFPERMVNWIRYALLKGTSKVIINSVARKNITLRRGVRQEDPLSPFIFNVAIDFLSRWIQKLGQLHLLVEPFWDNRLCLLYADDMLLLLQADKQQMQIVKMILHFIHQLSGLKVNLEKTEILVTADRHGKAVELASKMQYKASNFPTTYLGLPLSDRKLPKSSYMDLIHREEKKTIGMESQ